MLVVTATDFSIYIDILISTIICQDLIMVPLQRETESLMCCLGICYYGHQHHTSMFRQRKEEEEEEEEEEEVIGFHLYQILITSVNIG